MKKGKIISGLFLGSIVLFFASCGKYEDGPSISLRSRTERLCHTWVIEKVLVNSTVLTSDQIAMDEGKNVEMTLAKNGTLIMSSVDSTGQTVAMTGKWAFQNSDKEVKISIDGETAFDTDVILKLTNTEFWFWHMDGTDKMEMHWKTK